MGAPPGLACSFWNGCACHEAVKFTSKSYRGRLDGCTSLAQAHRMQERRDWMAAREVGPGPRAATDTPQPGSRDARKLSVSPEPGWSGATRRASRLRPRLEACMQGGPKHFLSWASTRSSREPIRPAMHVFSLAREGLARRNGPG